jgi:hypothetical protein
MSTENNVDVTTAAQPTLKSTDTRYKFTVEAPKTEPVKEAPKEPEPKAEKPVVPPEGEKQGDAPDADSPQVSKKDRMPRWVKERLERVRQESLAQGRESALRELQASPPKADPVKDEPKAKTLEDFDFDHGRYTDYLVEQKLSKREEEARIKAEQERQAKAAESFKARIDAFEERAGDGTWQDIVESPLNTDPAFKGLTDLFMGDDHDLDIAHHLATNLKEAERINKLPKLQQVREIAKLAEKFESGAQKEDVDMPSPPASLPKKTTSAPPPPKTVSGSGKSSVDINDPNMTTAQRIAAWRKAGKG